MGGISTCSNVVQVTVKWVLTRDKDSGVWTISELGFWEPRSDSGGWWEK
jgi:hypothetical protein